MTILTTRLCANCSNLMDVPSNNPKKKFCSTTCQTSAYYKRHKERRQQEWQEWYEKNRDYAKAKTKAYAQSHREQVRVWKNSELYDGLRRVILERDNFQCRACSDRVRVSVHHKDGTGWRSVGKHSGKINNVEDNLVTLCNSCHSTLHRWQERSDTILLNDDAIINKIREIKHARQQRRSSVQAAV